MAGVVGGDDAGRDPPRPATSRPAGAGDGSRLWVAAIVVVAALVAAVVKPWAWLGDEPGADAGGPPDALPSTPGPSPRATPHDWVLLDGRVACLGNNEWLGLVDLVDGGRQARSWTSVEPVAVTGPDDPAIARVRVFADAVLRIGFCAPVARAAGTLSPDSRLDVRAWRAAAPGAAGPAVEIRPVVASGGTLADGGLLLAPPGGATTWPRGRYVLRALLAGAGPGGGDAAWLAIDLRGPWAPPSPAVPAPELTPAAASPSPAP